MPDIVRPLALTASLLVRFWPQLLLIGSIGYILRDLLLNASVSVGMKHPLGGMVVLSLVVLTKLLVVVLMILGGAAALRQMDVPDAGGLSFLGVAMFVAVCLVVLLPSLLEPWMVIVAPVLCALSFALAHWIVSRFDEDVLAEEGPEPHDVR